MNRVTKQQVSFEKGMMETFKQEGLGAPDNLTSVLYLENYNPNIEQMSLVKRPGVTDDKMIEYGGFNYIRTPIDSHEQNTPLLPYTAANINGFWTDFVTNFIQHYTIIETSNFDSNKTHLLFSKANLEYAYIKATLMPDLSGFTDLLPSVLITSYSKYLASPTTTALTTGWYNSWKRYFDLSLRDPDIFEDRINAQQAFPGWWALGNFRDSVRYGESQLFSTSFNPSDIAALELTSAQQKLLLPYLYPVYKWALWDIRKKRNDGQQYWNGIPMGAAASGSASIDDVQNNIYTAWKILHPTRSKGISTSVQYRSAFNQNYPTPTPTWSQIDKDTNAVSAITDTFTDINLMLWVERIEDNLAYFNRHATGNWNASSPNNRRLGGSLFTASASTVPSINTIEIPQKFEIPKAIKSVVVGISKRRYGFANDGEWDDDYDTNTSKTATLINGRSFDYIETVEGRDGKNHLQRRVRAALAIGFPNYIQAQLPRPYFTGEELHFAITITINGIQYLLMQQKVILPVTVSFIGPVTETVYLDGNPETAFALNSGTTTAPGATTADELDNAYAYAYHSAYGNFGSIERDGVNVIIGERIQTTNGRPSTVDGAGESTANQAVMLKAWNTIAFSLMLTKKAMQTLMEQNAADINVYLLSADQEADFFSKVGVLSEQEPPATLYKPSLKADKDNIDYSKFGLLKKFLIEGKANVFDYEIDNEKPYEKLHYRATNAWYTPNTNGKYIWAIPQKFATSDTVRSSLDSTMFAAMPVMAGSTDDKDWSTLNHYANTQIEISGVDINSATVVSANKQWNYWTPDFYIWDYPSDTSFLALGGSGKYWEGTGAELLCTVQGITFISGCRNETFELEQAKVRWGVIQNGVASYDAFYKENEIKFGSLPHTALVNYRDTLWVFNREEFYRLALPNPYDTSTWQILDKQEGQGAFCTKQTIVTPYGVAYANENGIWMSDGGKPTCLTNNPNQGVGINGIYQRLAMGSAGSTRGVEQHPIIAQTISVSTQFAYANELLYDIENDELVYIAEGKLGYTGYDVLTSKGRGDGEIRLIFNFAKQNWRTETYSNGQLTAVRPITSGSFATTWTQDSGEYDNWLGLVSTSFNDVLNGRMHVANPYIWTLRLSLLNLTSSTVQLAASNNMIYPQFMTREKVNTIDYQYGTKPFTATETSGVFNGSTRFPAITNNGLFGIPIVGKVLTHIIGNGNDDYILKRVLATLMVRPLLSSPIMGIDLAGKGIDYIYTLPANLSPGTLKAMDYNNAGLPISAAQDPCLAYEVRSAHASHSSDAALNGLGLRTKYTDLIAMNYSTKNNSATNPFRSTLQTPGGTNQTNAIQRYTATESLVLNAPLNAQYRFIRFMFQSEVVQKIMGFVFESVQFGRRSQ